jgi:hypothetical protein
VVASGSAYWIFRLANTTYIPPNVVPKAIPGVTDILLRAMENLYGRFGRASVATTAPSTGNWSSVYNGTAANVGAAVPTNAA